MGPAAVIGPWDAEDSTEYRKARALAFANHAFACSRDLLRLKPTMMSWVPHVACFIVPRQMVEIGAPGRRSADACESFGASVKKIVKLLTCRRNMTARMQHGYVEQAFRRVTVRARLLHGAENAPFRSRQDHKLLGTGRRNDRGCKVEGPQHSVRVKMEQEASNS